MLSLTLRLPTRDRSLREFTFPERRNWPTPEAPLKSRIAYAAAHVVADPLADGDPASTCALDWDATLAYRRHLWSYGLGVAEAMDTAQRGTGLTWDSARELITRSVAEAKRCKGLIACGAGTDHLPSDGSADLESVLRAYELQCAHVEHAGGRVILMASRALARIAKSPDDYRRVYGRILDQVAEPVILHWLGEAFDPALSGYWGASNPRDAMQVCIGLIHDHRAKVDGIKISLLDAALEIEMRRLLPPGVHMYTGDDFGYPDLIRGDERGYSDALLGIFDAIAPAASAALGALDRGDVNEYRRILDPTLPLARQIFAPPTYHYKTGVVFLAYLNGYQQHFRMVGGKESARSIVHLSEVLVLAAEAGLLVDPGLAAERMKSILTQSGVH